MGKNSEIVELRPICVKTAKITIEGDGDICLNKMNARSERDLTDQRNDKKKVRQVPNKWEDIITAVRWRDGIPSENTYEECDENMYHKLLEENAPCITCFGLKKSFADAVVRNEIDNFSTKFNNAVNVVMNKGLVPVKFTEARVEERLMAPKKGSPVLVRMNYFSGWRAEFTIQYTENVYSLDSIVNIINLAGFGLGIGSGRSSGNGRYHVVNVTAA